MLAWFISMICKSKGVLVINSPKMHDYLLNSCVFIIIKLGNCQKYFQLICNNSNKSRVHAWRLDPGAYTKAGLLQISLN